MLLMSYYLARQDGNGFRTYFTIDGTFVPSLTSRKTLVFKDEDKALAAAAKIDALVLTDTQKGKGFGLVPV